MNPVAGQSTRPLAFGWVVPNAPLAKKIQDNSLAVYTILRNKLRHTTGLSREMLASRGMDSAPARPFQDSR